MTRRNHLSRHVSLAVLWVSIVTCGELRPPRLLQAQAEQPGKPESPDSAMVETGSKLFGGSCSVCHGIDGKGSARGPDLTRGQVVTRGKDDELSQLIRKGVPGSSMGAFDMPDLQIRQLVAFIRSLSTPAAHVAVPGNQNSGQQIFFGKGHCSECHMIRGQGGSLGPDLSNIGGERTLAEIRESILKPGSSSPNKYRGVYVVTESGERIEGTLRNRDNFSLQIMDRTGKFRFFLISELREVVLQEKSMMPNDIGSLLNSEEVQNLLAFLSRQAVVGGNQIENHRRRPR
ncbi:MAG TPA: c-type cytochrome [Terriglobia bacterium]|nr:c-type cytochrome [Terriglobia bacterium]